MNVAWSIYPGATGGGAGALVNGIDNALSRGLGDAGRGGGNPLGMLAMLGGLAAGAFKGVNSFGNRFKLYRDFKENWVKRPYNAVKSRLRSMLGMSDDVAKGAVNSVDDAVRGGAQAASRTASQAVSNSLLVDQFGKPINAAGAIDDAARGAAGMTDDVARSGGRMLGRLGGRALPVVGVAIDGAFRYQDYKTTEARYEKVLAEHKAGNISDEDLAVADHLRGAAHSRNASGMAGGLIGATLAAAGVGAAIGFGAGGLGSIPGFIIGAGVGMVGYFIGDKVGTSVSDAAWGEPPSYSQSAEVLNRNSAENGVARRGQGHDASQAWAAARQNSAYANTGDIRTPGIVTDPAAVGKFTNNLAGAGAGVAARQSQADNQARALARGRSLVPNSRQQSRQVTVG